MVPPCSDKVSRAPSYSKINVLSTCTGLSPIIVNLSRLFQFLSIHRSASPRSLATTSGVSVDFLSSGYLDVSIPQVCFFTLCIQAKITLKVLGCPIQTFPDQSLFSAPRNFSQSITSFIASYCQGIHQMPFSYLILLCVCEILKKSHTSYGPFASPIRLKVFTLNSLFFLSTRFGNTLLYSQMQILLKDLIYWFSSIYSYISYLQNLTTPWISSRNPYRFLPPIAQSRFWWR